LPADADARVDTDSWHVPPLFRVLVDAGQVARDEAYRAFNMGVGMVVIAAPADADAIVGGVRADGLDAWVMGDIVPGTRTVRL
jgi:phosphoribosylformylglycinamidine cyclo-ligase